MTGGFPDDTGKVVGISKTSLCRDVLHGPAGFTQDRKSVV